MIKPVALPRPRRAEAAALQSLESDAAPEATLGTLLERREALALQLGLLDAEIQQFTIRSICGDVDDTQDVELYDGTLGVSRAFVDRHEPPVGQLRWVDDLLNRFSGPGEDPGDVAGERWGSGALIARDVFLTAGHCFDQSGGGWQRPSRNERIIPPAEIATLMRVYFNFQVDGQTVRNGRTGDVRPGVPFPVTELLEYRLSGVDYALVRLGRDEAGHLPGDRFGVLPLAQADLTTPGAMLCVIQHPNGRPKRIEAGPLAHNNAGEIAYDSIDTQGASSGSPVLSEAGEIVGVHRKGGCTAFGGLNIGQAIGRIRQASRLID